MDIFSMFFNMKVYCVFSLESPHPDDSNEYTQDTIFNIQSTLVISNSKGPSETLRDIHTSTYQTCRTEESTNQTTKFHK